MMTPWRYGKGITAPTRRRLGNGIVAVYVGSVPL